LSHPAGDERSAWFLRPVILLATAYLIIVIIHESAHALTAYALDVPFTLFHFGVNLARDRGSLMELAAIGVAGPLSSLIIGLTCWLFYRSARGLRSELMLLYLATFGVGTFFGNLMSSAFVGDFSRAGEALRLPMPARYAASLVGFLSVCGLHFWTGWELRRLSPAGSSRLHAMIVMVLLPVVAETVILTLSFIPIPSALVFGRLAEASFWVFGAAGVLMSRNTPSGSSRTLHLGWADVAILAAAIIAVRIMASGIAFQQ
jgi:hypothetical protein